MNYIMKSSELHRLITENDWILIRVSGSHYIYQKGDKTYPVPYHGSKEVGKGLEKKVKKENHNQKLKLKNGKNLLGF